MSIFDLYGLGDTNMSHFCEVAYLFHQDFDLEDATITEALDAFLSFKDPAWRSAFAAELAMVLKAVPDPNEFITVFVNAGAEHWIGDARAELAQWLADERDDST